MVAFLTNDVAPVRAGLRPLGEHGLSVAHPYLVSLVPTWLTERFVSPAASRLESLTESDEGIAGGLN
jgi:hypothetical protein